MLKDSIPVHTRDDLVAHLNYDEFTGLFRWKLPRKRIKVGDIAGSPCNGYSAVVLKGQKFLAHRLAWLFAHGEWPAFHIDHINGDRSDNRVANLRRSSPAENMQNKRRAHANNEAGILGVRRKGEKFAARIAVNGREFSLGTFDTDAEARAAYIGAKRVLHPAGTL